MAVTRKSKRSRTTGKSTVRSAVRRISQFNKGPIRKWHNKDPFDRDVMMARMDGLLTLKRTGGMDFGKGRELELRGFLSIMRPEYTEDQIYQMAREMAKDE